MTNYKSQNLVKIVSWQHLMNSVVCFHLVHEKSDEIKFDLGQ
jgi:hypothetical protein